MAKDKRIGESYANTVDEQDEMKKLMRRPDVKIIQRGNRNFKSTGVNKRRCIKLLSGHVYMKYELCI